ncbi:carboxypeptidase-like regulatory domain-containing protein [Aquiflexum sp.]|uniref:carboxypeptidase-like regulatory domain-containing protein n=1 Tax=Aquiflexum sp. TaxID=1872584 RepID=UPI00359347E9
MKNFITFFFLIFILAFPQYAFSQFEIKGNILDSETNIPLEFATVFINNTTFGDITDREGNFTIQIPAGYHELIISFVGYQTFRYSFNTRTLAKNYTFKIFPEIFDLEETQIFENGSYFHPFDIYIEGYMAWEKVGDLMPLDYGMEKIGSKYLIQ